MPNNSVVDINDPRIPGVDSTPTSGSTNVVTSDGVFSSLRMDKIRPLETHTYSNILTNSTYVTSGYILFQAKPIVWDEPVLVKYRMQIYVDGRENLYYSKNECFFALFHAEVSAYSCKNYIGNTSYKTIYYHSLYCCNAENKDIGHLFGFCYYNAGASYSRNCTTSGYGRTFVVEILEADNCTITWPNACAPASDIPGYVAERTHYPRKDYNGYSKGETHTDAEPPVAPGTLNTTATTSQTTSSQEALSGNVILHKVSKTGSYNDLLNKPTIPSAPGTLITNATTAQTASSGEAMTGSITLHKVSKTGTYSDLVGKPTVDSSPTGSSSNLVSSGGVYTALQSKPDYVHLSDESEMPATPDAKTMYLIDEEGSGGGGGASIVYLTDESQMPANPDANTLYVILES